MVEKYKVREKEIIFTLILDTLFAWQLFSNTLKQHTPSPWTTNRKMLAQAKYFRWHIDQEADYAKHHKYLQVGGVYGSLTKL